MNAMDDILDCADFVEINKNNYQIIKNKAIKIGYADGVNDGRESVFQRGFDKGYRDGLSTAFTLTKYRSFFENVTTEKVNNSNLLKEKDEFLTLEVKNLKTVQIEGNGLNLDSQDYVNKSLKIFTQQMPVATELLSAYSNADI